MKDEKQVQNDMPIAATDNQTPAQKPDKPPKLLYKDWLQNQEDTVFVSGDIYVIPRVKIERNEFYSNTGELMYGYFIPVKYHGESVEVRLTTPIEYDPNSKKNVKDRYGYKMFDALYKDCSQVNLGLKFNYYPDSKRLRSINYFMCGYDDYGYLDYLPLEVDRASSESTLRSAINRLRMHFGLELPEF